MTLWDSLRVGLLPSYAPSPRGSRAAVALPAELWYDIGEEI